MTDWLLDNQFEIGNRVETRDGSFRGNIVKIDEEATKWPYLVEDGTGKRRLYSASELRKTDLEISSVSVTEALVQLGAMIDTKQRELSTLQMARRVLEQVEDHG